MSWKPEVQTDGTWSGNAMRFATKDEAMQWGQDLLLRWFTPTDYRAVEVDEPVNYKIEEGELFHVV